MTQQITPNLAPIVSSFTYNETLKELEGIRNHLVQSRAQDSLSKDLDQWRVRFQQCLRLDRNTQRVVDAFTTSLQKILVDSISHTPLDEHAWLGSDGHTYGHMPLSLRLKEMPEIWRTHSPLNPKDPRVFTVQRHPNVPYMIGWLRSHGIQPVNDPNIAKQYESLKKADALPRMPEGEKEVECEAAVRRIHSLREARRIKISALTKAWAAEDAEKTEKRFAAIDKRIDDYANHKMKELHERIQTNQKTLNTIQSVITKLNQEASQLEQDIHQLQKMQKDMDIHIETAKEEDRMLEIGIKELEELQKKRKISWLKELTSAVLIIGGCAFGTWALQGILTAAGTGASAAVLPAASGTGARIGISIPLLL